MPHRKLVATLDLGSNSFHMLIARVEGDKIYRLDSLKESVRLRAALEADGSISDAGQTRALQCLERFAQRMRGLDPHYIRVVGTNTLRRAKKIRTFLERMEAILPVPVDVIGGSEEARLIYRGVAPHLPKDQRTNLVLDIGGSSTELILGVGLEPKSKESRPMGCVAYTLEYFPKLVPTKRAFNQAVLSARGELERYQREYGVGAWDRAVGASGTIKAIAQIQKQVAPDSADITREGMDRIFERLPWNKALTAESLPGLKEDRVPVFLGGFAVLYGLFQSLGIEQMQVSPYSLREGVLYDLLGRDQNEDKREETVRHLQEIYSVDRLQAERVEKAALSCFHQVEGHLTHRRDVAHQVLAWSARLHELGLVIAHTGYHKHGAYIITNGDMDGFSQVEQGLLGFLVVNHRKRLKTDLLQYEKQLDWPLVFVLRLATIFNRERIDFVMPKLRIDWGKPDIRLTLEAGWLNDRPLTRYDLQIEQGYWRRIGYKLSIEDGKV